MKVEVFIEETLCRRIEFDLPDDMTEEERMEAAEELATRAYKNCEIVLDADDMSGTSIMVRDVTTEHETDWRNI